MNTARLTGACALGVAVLYALSVPVGSFASAPHADASAAEVWRFAAEHRAGILVAVVLNGLAWCTLMPVAFLGLRELLGRDGGIAARVAVGCALVVSALVGVLLACIGVLAYAAPHIRPDLSQLLSQMSYVVTSASAWPTIPCSIALAVVAHRARLSRIVVGVAVASVALECVSAVSFARSGALSPTGIAMLAPAAFATVMALIGLGLLRRRAVMVAPETAPAL